VVTDNSFFDDCSGRAIGRRPRSVEGTWDAAIWTDPLERPASAGDRLLIDEQAFSIVTVMSGLVSTVFRESDFAMGCRTHARHGTPSLEPSRCRFIDRQMVLQ
jgi:hypothetical protein